MVGCAKTLEYASHPCVWDVYQSEIETQLVLDLEIWMLPSRGQTCRPCRQNDLHNVGTIMLHSSRIKTHGNLILEGTSKIDRVRKPASDHIVLNKSLCFRRPLCHPAATRDTPLESERSSTPPRFFETDTCIRAGHLPYFRFINKVAPGHIHRWPLSHSR